VRGVTTEWRTRLLNCRARLRSAEFFRVFFSIGDETGDEPDRNRTNPSSTAFDAAAGSAVLNSRTNPRRIAWLPRSFLVKAVPSNVSGCDQTGEFIPDKLCAVPLRMLQVPRPELNRCTTRKCSP